MVPDPYLIPGSDTLRNLPGFTDAAKLREYEYHLTVLRRVELDAHPIGGHHDLAHLQAIHHHLFQDMYDWAGQVRTVNIVKGNTPFAYAHALIPAATDLFDQLARENRLEGLDHPTFVDRAAYYLGELNALHPFRDGNGRTQQTFIADLASRGGWHIDWDPITAEQNIAASIASFGGDKTAFVELLTTITTPLAAGVDPRPLRFVPNPKPSASRRPRR